MKTGNIILINGISGSGKTTLALKLKNYLEAKGERVYVIDGDESRNFFNDLDYSQESRFIYFKRNCFGAYLLSNNGIDVILSVNVNTNELREFIKNRTKFIEIFLDADVRDCMNNDPKGVYKKYSENGGIPGFNMPFEKPKNPDLTVYPYREPPDKSLMRIVEFLKKNNLTNPVKRVVYSGTLADLSFHYGHLKALKFASSLGDYYICGVLTNEAAKSYRREPLFDLEKRKAIIEQLKFVDRVMVQESKDSTGNLKKIHDEFKDAKIILVRADTWEGFPEREFLESIGGEIITHPYYKEISDFKIINYILKNYKGQFKDFEDFTSYFKIKNFIEFGKEVKSTIISTKANTLKIIQPLLKNSSIEKTFVFTVFDWKNKNKELLESIKYNFFPNKIVVRSSTLVEDTTNSSMAGHFHTELNVSSGDFNEVSNSIEKVISSYNGKDPDDDLNQVLIQKQTSNIRISGVLFTRSLENSAPYYVINYDDLSGSSDTVTKGIENKNVKVSKFCNPKNYPNDLYKLLIAVKEIEEIIQEIPLDIEFAITNEDQIVIFQVRPIITKNLKQEVDDEQIKDKIDNLKKKFSFFSKKRNHLAGDFTYFGDMPDWNPAEIIGDNPNFMDYSLYDYLITNSAWHEARASQGYFDVNPAKLVVLFGNKPYVDVRNSFNSFIPNPLPRNLKEKLLNFYLNKLKKRPEFQDKVEFEILYTCYDFCFNETSKELLQNDFEEQEILELKESLIDITNNLLINSSKLIEYDLNFINEMERIRKEIVGLPKNEPNLMLKNSIRLLDNCRKNGTVQFSRLARLAFIGKIILKSLVNNGTIDKNVYNSFLESVNTVAKSMSRDFSLLSKGNLCKEDFLEKYGHLRPGTYDITSKRYDKDEILFDDFSFFKAVTAPFLNFSLEKEDEKRMNEVIKKDGNLNINPDFLLSFVKRSLEARELSKFEFTKGLSDAMELIAESGEKLGFSRGDMSYLDIETLIKIGNINETDVKPFLEEIISLRKKERYFNSFLILPPIIFSEKDFDIVSYYTAKPNFVTQKRVVGDIVSLNSTEEIKPDLKDKIVVIENGDPGYDWIFTKNIAGLITKYGGVASHMSIRCSEFGIPAAIGCGDLIFNRISTSRRVDLNCEAGRLELI